MLARWRRYRTFSTLEDVVVKAGDPSTDLRGLVSTEFRLLDFIEAERLGVACVDSLQFIPSFLTMALLEENFLRAVLLGDEYRFFRFGKRDRSCRLISEHGDAVDRRNELQRRCLHGFEALLVIRRRGSQVRDFFLSGGYCVEGESTVGSGQPFDVLEVPDNADLVEEGLAMLDLQPEEPSVPRSKKAAKQTWSHSTRNASTVWKIASI